MRTPAIPAIIQQKLDADARTFAVRASRNRLNDRHGKQSQTAVGSYLQIIGVQQVYRIETGWSVKFFPGTRRVKSAYPLAKVPGDFRGILPGGRSVLAECKDTSGDDCDRLVFSKLAKHQVDALDLHHQTGGLSLLCWTWPGGMAVMVWPVVEFQPGTSITSDTARSLNLTGLP